jgi:hypothetical protein
MEKQKSGAQREYLKLIGEEPTSVMPDEMEKLVSELSRDTEIVALFKRISDECMIARPGPAIAPQG